MLDLDQIRERILARMQALKLAPTGKWLPANGIGQTTLRNFFDGSSRSMTLETLIKLAKPLQTTEQWILYGDGEPSISDEVIAEIAGEAVEEIQAGMPIGQIRSTVASTLHELLRRHLAQDASPDSEETRSALGTAVQSPSATMQDDLVR